MSVRETPKVSLLRGGYPEVLARPRAASLWFSSYLQTYLERDVRSISAVHDLATFRRFLALLASRHGQVLNKSDLAAALGMSVPGIGRWLDILEATLQVLIVPPFFENLGKRLIKSPKIYVADSGLACHLLGIETDAELRKSPFVGLLFEGFGDREGPGQRRPAARDLFLSRPAGVGSGFRRAPARRGSPPNRSQSLVHRDAGHGRTDATAGGGPAETSRRPRDRRHGGGALAHAGGDVFHRAGARRQSAPLAAVRHRPAGLSASKDLRGHTESGSLRGQVDPLPEPAERVIDEIAAALSSAPRR
jgi:hypothetical protein